MDNFFTSTKLIRYLQLKSIAATGTVRLCRMENPPLKDVKMMEKEARGASDVAVDANINMAAVRWKDNKVVNVLSTFAGKDPVQKVKRYSQEAKKKNRYSPTKSCACIQPLHGWCRSTGSKSCGVHDQLAKQKMVVAFISILHRCGY